MKRARIANPVRKQDDPSAAEWIEQVEEEQVLAKGRRIFSDDGLLRKMSESVNRAARP